MIPGLSGTSNPYLSIIAVLVESYSLDSAWSIATAVSINSNSPSSYLFVPNDSTIKVCHSTQGNSSFFLDP